MSINWFRWYHGSISDPKFTVISRKSRQPRALVLAMWAAILEFASQADERGSVEKIELDTIAACLDADDEAVESVFLAMTEKGLIVDNRVDAWDRRQVYREDDSRDRVRKFREKNKGIEEVANSVTQGNAPVTQGNAPVTPQSTDTDQIQRRTEQNRERERSARKHAKPARSKTDFPADLAITPELQAWADKNGYVEPMAAHLDNFRDKSIAKGYQYADWTAALRNAIRDDWAGLRKPQPDKRAATGGGRNGGFASNPNAGEFAAIMSGKSIVIEGELAHVAH